MTPPILVVDDEAVNRQFLSTILGYDGHAVIEAGDAAEALELVRARRPSLVISDIVMPAVDGYEFVRQLRKDPAIAHTPVIFYTANYFEREARGLALACGVAHVLTKPCEPETILATVRKALHDDRPAARPPDDPEAYHRQHLRLITDKLSAKVRELEAAQEHLAALNQELETRVAERTAELKRSNEDLEQFAYVASHDLQEPLRMVSSYTSLLAKRYKGRLDADADEFIGYAVDGAARMQELIADLLTYSRINRGATLAPVVMDDALDAALERVSLAIRDADAVITRDPLPTLMADRAQIVQLFQNLLSNAIKFRGDARPEVHVGATLQNDAWTISVRDNGIGIDPQYADRIFTIFQRLHNRAAYPGTGIGLAICKRIVTRLGGLIWVKSQPGAGSTFYFTVPATLLPGALPQENT